MKTQRKNLLKRSLSLASLALGLMLSVAALSACHDDDANGNDSEANLENILELTANPTADQYGVKFDKKTVVLGSAESAYNTAVTGRLTSTTNEISEDAKAFVFMQGYDMDFNEEDLTKMIKAYINGATFILLEPNLGNIVTLRATAAGVVKDLFEAGEDVSGAEDFVQKLAALQELNMQDVYDETEAIAFRKHDVYVVRDLNLMTDSSNCNTTGLLGSEGDNYTQRQCEEDDYEPTAYDRGVSADMLFNWLNEDAPAVESVSKSSRASSAEQTIDNYMTGERYVIQQQVGPSRALDKTLRYEMVYTVYSAYNFDNNTDYYFVRLRPNFHCSALGCPTGEKDWIYVNKVVRFDDGSTAGEFFSAHENYWYGTYMSGFNFTGEIVNADKTAVQDVTLLDASPKTDVSGTSGYSTGINFSLSGNVGLNASGPTGGITGGVTFTESTSHSEPSLQVHHSEEGGVTKWNISGIQPHAHVPLFTSRWHDLVATFQRTDWQTEFTWIVSIKDAAKQGTEPFYVKATDITEITDLNIYKWDYELRTHPTQVQYIKLPTPNRFRHNYIISCSNNDLQNVLKDQFSKSWSNEFTYYGKSEDELLNGAKAYFAKVKTSINGYLEEIVEKGFTGEYTVRLKTVEGETISSFVINNGKIVDAAK